MISLLAPSLVLYTVPNTRSVFKLPKKLSATLLYPRAGCALPTISFAAHAADHAMAFKHFLEIIAAILATTI
jgi:hypothetical protein